MGKVMKASAIVDKAKWIATKLKTLYILGPVINLELCLTIQMNLVEIL